MELILLDLKNTYSGRKNALQGTLNIPRGHKVIVTVGRVGKEKI